MEILAGYTKRTMATPIEVRCPRYYHAENTLLRLWPPPFNNAGSAPDSRTEVSQVGGEHIRSAALKKDFL